ncbi:DUF4138 domain-containing protein [Sediminicola arcticus]|uniref:DUF4138 domain-containing protein n=1 Tax=Sediminicola arcticus TaxID=1574308 RepID=A0ABV2SPT1_9FLAO
MKKMLYPFIFLCSICSVSAQAIKPLDTIYANEHKAVALFFPSTIKHGITGSTNFVFSFNRVKQQRFGLLQAYPGAESNLLVLGSDGQVFSYILRYGKKLSQLNYFIPKEESIGNETGQTSLRFQENKTFTALDSKAENSEAIALEKLCRQLLKTPRPFNQIKQNKGVVLKMTNSMYHGDQVFVVFEIQNKSQIDYEINALDLYRVNGTKKRKSSYQEVPLKSVYQFKRPSQVSSGSKVQFVQVYPKFTLGKNERLKITLGELNGGRNLNLKLR